MAQVSQKLLGYLTDFLTMDLDSKALDGITYALMLKDCKSDMENCKRYKEIKKETAKCGFSNDEVFRIYEVSNGYIFDMDIGITRSITARVVASFAKKPTTLRDADVIKEKPDARRKQDLIRLAKSIKQSYESGNHIMEVALFSKNSVPRIVVNGTGPNGEALSLRFNAYAIRHWDIEALNTELLIPIGLRVSKIEPCEILASKTGVRFILHIEKV